MIKLGKSKEKKGLGKRIIVITGISGAGKTKALQFFGDFGFHCVDNLPMALFKEFASYVNDKKLNNVALGVDIREGEDLKALPRIVKELKKEGVEVKIIFLNASDAKLVQRFSETKHKHPIAKELVSAIEQERAALRPIRDIADEEIDTTNLTLGELKEKISAVIGAREKSDMMVRVMSFGYKYGVPLEADLMFDVRFLPNPYYQQKLREKTGLDKKVSGYLSSFEESGEFLKKLKDIIEYLLPKYVKEGKSYLTIAIGCTGGKHRSVFMAHSLAELLGRAELNISEYHRDINK